MEPDALDALVRRLRRAPMAPARDTVPVDHGRAAVERILPHRAPFLLVDGVTGVDLAARRVFGRRHVDARDPVFDGHFPGDPVYPGVLLLEAIGQLGLCLAHFVTRETTAVAEGDEPTAVRALRVHHAVFCAAVRPGDELTLGAELVEHDGFTGVVAGQVCRGAEVCAVGVMEVYFVES